MSTIQEADVLPGPSRVRSAPRRDNPILPTKSRSPAGQKQLQLRRDADDLLTQMDKLAADYSLSPASRCALIDFFAVAFLRKMDQIRGLASQAETTVDLRMGL